MQIDSTSFDVVVSVLVLNFVPEPALAVGPRRSTRWHRGR
jgi:hypothetical protein